MFHHFTWKIQKIWSETLIFNDLFGIQALYAGPQKQGAFFLYPYLDDQKKTVLYFAFDDHLQKTNFEKMLKISGVWPKTAFQIVQIPALELKSAIEKLDTKFFQSIPGIGPKLAKKIILELKDNFQLEDAQTIDSKHKQFKNIVKSLKNLGYDTEKVKTILTSYNGNLETDDLTSIIKRVISQI